MKSDLTAKGRPRCPQAGGAGTKGARPLGCRNVRKSQARRQIRRRAAIRDLCSLKAALLSRRENLRKKTTISDIVIQRAAGPSRRAGDSAPCRDCEMSRLTDHPLPTIKY